METSDLVPGGRSPENAILTLMRPRILSFKNSMRQGRGLKNRLSRLFLWSMGIIFWLAIFWVSHRVLVYFSSIEELGRILAFKLMALVFVTFFSLLIFSGILVVLSKLYLSKDLLLVLAMPVPGYKIFAARWLECLVDSSWMVIVFAVPLFAAYGMIFDGLWFYYLTLGMVLVLLSTGACTISAIAMMAAVVVLPANRIRTIFVFVGLALFIGLYVGVRVIRPERLVDPEVFTSTLVYLQAMQTAPLPFLPSTWAYDALVAALTGQRLAALFHLGLLASFSAVMGVVMLLVADLIYFKGVSRAQSAPARLFRQRRLKFFGLGFLSLPVAALVFKEIKSFFRDQTQWSQLFLIFALIGIYVYNFKVLPLERSPMGTVFLGNALAFLNMGLALFVLTAIAGRFVFPCVSMEGEAFWIIRTSPVTLGQFLWVKHVIYLVPLFVLTLVLIVATNLLLRVDVFMMVLSLVNVCLMVPGVVSLGVGCGAIFADFKSENPAQTLSSQGGLLFMVFSVLFIGAVIMIEAGPVYAIFKAGFHGRPLGTGTIVWSIVSFVLAGGLCATAVVLPMRLGKKHLEQRLCA
ncbi:conserved hypothetical protein [Desulforapulum autotrophicum HRM2]|uniref:Uncharacterized protein n=1 Tax=Desulforapulum autotrophicum (strain ATCC 43914 / DSM 3382 / VKM B-1955 / HRM2) TaxID=177437 RepID=C0QMC6_DESAH|nr:hypothetical protein [Desulforapulum autotrophicum]ACN16443.1 conserved hypothetical protein [Desulforapulum autotrophicum HRM2]